MDRLETTDDADTAPIRPHGLDRALGMIQDGFLSETSLEDALRLCEGRRVNLVQLRETLVAAHEEIPESIRLAVCDNWVSVTFPSGKFVVV